MPLAPVTKATFPDCLTIVTGVTWVMAFYLRFELNILYPLNRTTRETHLTANNLIYTIEDPHEMTEKCSIRTGFRTEFWHFRCNSDVSYYAFISVESDGIDCVTCLA